MWRNPLARNFSRRRYAEHNLIIMTSNEWPNVLAGTYTLRSRGKTRGSTHSMYPQSTRYVS